jgi:CyaY protein
MTDSEFHLKVEQWFDHLEQCIETQELDVDVDRHGPVLTIEFQPGSEIVINKQEPLHQIWLASKFSGHHFSFVENSWLDRRNQIALTDCLVDAFKRQAGLDLTL